MSEQDSDSDVIRSILENGARNNITIYQHDALFFNPIGLEGKGRLRLTSHFATHSPPSNIIPLAFIPEGWLDTPTGIKKARRHLERIIKHTGANYFTYQAHLVISEAFNLQYEKHLKEIDSATTESKTDGAIKTIKDFLPAISTERIQALSDLPIEHLPIALMHQNNSWQYLATPMSKLGYDWQAKAIQELWDMWECVTTEPEGAAAIAHVCLSDAAHYIDNEKPRVGHEPKKGINTSTHCRENWQRLPDWLQDCATDIPVIASQLMDKDEELKHWRKLTRTLGHDCKTSTGFANPFFAAVGLVGANSDGLYHLGEELIHVLDSRVVMDAPCPQYGKAACYTETLAWRKAFAADLEYWQQSPHGKEWFRDLYFLQRKSNFMPALVDEAVAKDPKLKFSHVHTTQLGSSATAELLPDILRLQIAAQFNKKAADDLPRQMREKMPDSTELLSSPAFHALAKKIFGVPSTSHKNTDELMLEMLPNTYRLYIGPKPGHALTQDDDGKVHEVNRASLSYSQPTVLSFREACEAYYASLKGIESDKVQFDLRAAAAYKNLAERIL